jgi:hypothetical protein
MMTSIYRESLLKLARNIRYNLDSAFVENNKLVANSLEQLNDLVTDTENDMACFNCKDSIKEINDIIAELNHVEEDI